MRSVHLALVMCLAAAAALPADAVPEASAAETGIASGDVANGAGNSVPSSEAAVRAADEAMASAVARGDTEAFTELIAEDAVFLSGTALHGRRAVVAGWLPLLGPDAATRLIWAPEEARVAESGELAYTVGDYQTITEVAGGEDQIARGRYVSVWRRGEDGAWRVVADGPVHNDRDRFVRDTLTRHRELVPGTRLAVDWRPARTERAASGELAYTLGTFDVRLEQDPGSGPSAAVRVTGGSYLEVWVRSTDAEGVWRPAVDSVTRPRPVEAASD